MQRWRYAVLSADKRGFTLTTEYERREYPDGEILEILNDLGESQRAGLGAGQRLREPLRGLFFISSGPCPTEQGIARFSAGCLDRCSLPARPVT